MIKVEVIEDFNLKEFGKIQNLERKHGGKIGSLFVGDTFDCDKEMAEYLTGNNALNKTVVKVLEVIPEKKEVKEEAEPSEKVIEKVEKELPKVNKKKGKK